MLLANYDSDSDGSDASGPSSPPAKPAASAPAAKPAVGKKRKGPVKISLDLPKPAADEKRANGAKGDGNDAEEDEDAGRKDKRKAGAGSSALLGMLPPPKRKLPVASTPGTAGLRVNRSMAKPAASAPSGSAADDEDDEVLGPVPKVVKRKAGADAELDLFGLSTAPAPKLPKIGDTSAKPPVISSAPAVADFVPPEPTAADPYPGYYQLPSGEWAAYEAGYYASFFAAGTGAGADAGLAAEQKRKAGRVGRDWAALDDGRADVVDIDASSGLAAARAEAERVARLTKPRLPGDEFQYDPIGQTKGLAQERHQLSSLLSSAYSQRDELEQRIAESKKNMRMAQQKYGF